MTIRIFFLTVLALVFFAANSVLCRLALGDGNIDATMFTVVRLGSGAAVLILIAWFQKSLIFNVKANAWGSLFLFSYAIFFSLAYLKLSAATGALILFAVTQFTMSIYALVKGERFSRLSIAGMVVAFAGLVYLLAPGLHAPPPESALLMVIAGVAWGAYTLLGRNSASPLSTTTGNFVFTIPLALVCILIFQDDLAYNNYGLLMAILSGALASAIGYIVWYSVLPHLSAISAASSQLSVPVIAAIGSVLFLSESITSTLVISSILTLGGIYLTIRGSHSIETATNNRSA